ncbi:IS110 family transposase [Adlercreutzia sp. ZJ242]|uniref:IS110 family transposase n=1 Tax=Adlercreutzia sp. ZJ242 TaxID=2709409 RepID=UPI0013ED2BD6|nr:IS110 family transposase [Adlercreutzia sp. ZJ242]
MAEERRFVIGGVDTHRDRHCAAAVDATGAQLGCRFFAADGGGYAELVSWLEGLGELRALGVEGSGGYGAGLCAYAQGRGVPVVEVSWPDRAERRRRGKSDQMDAYHAAASVLSGRAHSPAKDRRGDVEGLRALRVAYEGAVKARTAARNSLHALVAAAPDRMRARLRALPARELVGACASLRAPGEGPLDAERAAEAALRSVARRVRALDGEAAELGALIDAMTLELAPATRALPQVGPQCAAALVLCAGANPGRLASEASFSALCGASPVPVSSGRTDRHRLNLAGDRRANSALYLIAIGRMRSPGESRDFVAARMASGKTKREAIRMLKRYIARQVFHALRRDLARLAGASGADGGPARTAP